MNEKSFWGKTSFIKFYAKNGKKCWAYFAEKNSEPGAKITTMFRLTWKYFNGIITKTA